jgi:hypothetical protein
MRQKKPLIWVLVLQFQNIVKLLMVLSYLKLNQILVTIFTVALTYQQLVDYKRFLKIIQKLKVV